MRHSSLIAVASALTCFLRGTNGQCNGAQLLGSQTISISAGMGYGIA